LEHSSYNIYESQAFEWVVQDVGKLRDFVEGTDLGENPDGRAEADRRGEFEILRESPMLGDGKYKLEIGKKFA
jgi:hypothetical protein